MPSRLTRAGIGVLTVAVPATALILTTTTSAPAAEKRDAVGAAVAVVAVDGGKTAQTPVELPKTAWGKAADHEDRHARASRAASPYRFGSIAFNKWFAKQYMQQKYGWGADQFAALEQLWQRESGWSQTAHNSSSGAHGIPQALPGSKMGMFGADWATNPETQIKWGLHYIKSVYGSPSGALASSHSRGWY
ncbi:MAG: hypothetical protein R2720_06300 [Candidatus Nanopelagicales bacterium]